VQDVLLRRHHLKKQLRPELVEDRLWRHGYGMVSSRGSRSLCAVLALICHFFRWGSSRCQREDVSLRWATRQLYGYAAVPPRTAPLRPKGMRNAARLD
jgi:hypothetical protein